MSSITLSLVQSNIFWKKKQENLQMLEEKIASISTPTELILLPQRWP